MLEVCERHAYRWPQVSDGTPHLARLDSYWHSRGYQNRFEAMVSNNVTICRVSAQAWPGGSDEKRMAYTDTMCIMASHCQNELRRQSHDAAFTVTTKAIEELTEKEIISAQVDSHHVVCALKLHLGCQVQVTLVFQYARKVQSWKE